jgi:hypothetical protein
MDRWEHAAAKATIESEKSEDTMVRQVMPTPSVGVRRPPNDSR